MFQLTEVTEAKLVHINIRRELHGGEHVNAVDLSLRMTGSNDLLDMFDPKLRESLYCNRAATAGQELLPEVLAVLPNVRFPRLNNLKFQWAKGERMKGYNLVLDYGLGPERSNVDFEGCTVSNTRFELKEGGSVVIDWTVSYAGEELTSDTRGLLTGLTDETVFIQLLPEPGMTVVKGKDKPAASGGPDDEGEGDEGGDLLDQEGGEEGEGEDAPEAGSPEAAFLAEAQGESPWPFPKTEAVSE